jgi:nitrite reductase/ring-hydroxylating ferredoxin subunit/uncharacterized membrane protein
MNLHGMVEKIGTVEALDGVAKPLTGVVKRVIGRGFVKDTLSGTALGHPVHPMLTDIPIGAFSSAALLDLVGGSGAESAADALVAAGIVTALPTALSGAADWSETYGEDSRMGLVHALANAGALALYAASFVARRRGRRSAGRNLGLAGMAVMSAGGYLGGHLSYSSGVGVNHTFFQHAPEDWTTAATLAELTEGKPHRATAGDMPVLLVRQGERVHAIASRCTHAGGPLDEGDIDLSSCTVTCPWHQSEFRLDDGSVVHGPASVPQPALQTRIVDGRVEVRATS